MDAPKMPSRTIGPFHLALSMATALGGVGLVQAEPAPSHNRSNLPFDTQAKVDQAKLAMLCTQKYSWEFGVAMQALIECGDERNLVIMAREAVQRNQPKGKLPPDGRLALVGSEMNIADTGANGPGVLAAYAITGDETFKQAAQGLYDYLSLPTSRNRSGMIYHNNLSPVIFSDNLYMVAPFLAQMGNHDDALFQIEAMRRLLWNPEKKLFHHIRIEETGEFKDPSFWGGGVGWCAAAMATVVDLLPNEREADRQRVMQYTREVLDGCIAHQLPSGLLYDRITEPNFEETTLPCMLAFTIYKSVKSGWLDESYLAAADKMRAAAHVNLDEYGLLQNASKAPNFNSPGTSTEGQAFFIMMESAHRKLHEAAR
jgi:unsaturated rhamnogalacturonyl hydrolase